MSYNYESVNCIICGENNSEIISEKGQFNLPVKVVLCKTCGLGYLNPRWDESSYFNFYKHEYDKYYRPKLEGLKGEKQEINDTIIKRIDNYKLMPHKVKNVLDIGSGAGENLLSFGQKFPKSELYAIEPSKIGQSLLNKKGVKVISESINTEWEKEYQGFFDVVLLRHVLEHFLNPIEMLKKIRGVLKEDGILYVAVPNNLKPSGRLEGFWFRVVHTYYFTIFSLKNVFHLSNLKELKIVEGDEYNKYEVFAIVKKSFSNSKPMLSTEHFLVQNELFKRLLKKERRLDYKLTVIAKRIVNKITSFKM